MDEEPEGARAFVAELVGDRAGDWETGGDIPSEVLRALGERGLLCAEVPTRYGGLGLSSRANGEFTAFVGTLSGSLRTVLTSQGMAAWSVLRFGRPEQRDKLLPALTGGQLAAVGFSERAAGSDLSAIGTVARPEGDAIVLDGSKTWMSVAAYADLLFVVCREGTEAVLAVVPATTPGVIVERVRDPLGCRAAGHADVRFDAVRLPAESRIGGTSFALPLLVTTVLAYGRISIAWGCAGILRACLSAACAHASGREQFGRPLAEHQLVARHLAELFVAEQTTTRACEHASRCWDEGRPDMVVATTLAKYVGATQAARGSSAAVQVLGGAGAHDRHVVARAYRDAKVMELIEGTNEIGQLTLARHALQAQS